MPRETTPQRGKLAAPKPLAARAERLAAAASPASPPLRWDQNGCLIPFTAAQRAIRAEAVRRMFAELAEIPANPVEEDHEIYRAIDAERPDRPLFEGKY